MYTPKQMKNFWDNIIHASASDTVLNCPKFLSPLRVLDKCYDRIPILFERTTKVVDPITRQTYDFASEIPCLGDYTNVFQLDLENDNSW